MVGVCQPQDRPRAPAQCSLLLRRHDAVFLHRSGDDRHPADALLPPVRGRGLRVGGVHHDHGAVRVAHPLDSLVVGGYQVDGELWFEFKYTGLFKAITDS